jgi:excisionase family DNA binding protein
VTTPAIIAGNLYPLTPRPDRDTPQPPPGGGRVIPVAVNSAVYTVKEVATLLSLGLGTTYAMLRSGDIPARKIGAQWIISRRRFHAWLDALPEASTEDIEREFARAQRAEDQRRRNGA